MKFPRKLIWASTLVGIAAQVYIHGVTLTNSYLAKNSPRIVVGKLDETIAKEFRKITRENMPTISTRFVTADQLTPSTLAHSALKEDGTYEIVLGPDAHDLSTLRHELYHIAAGHSSSNKERTNLAAALNYLFLQEPAATFYALKEHLKDN